MPRILNDAGEPVFNAGSDAEAVRWWRDEGRPGDVLEDTGELLSEVDSILGLHALGCKCSGCYIPRV